MVGRSRRQSPHQAPPLGQVRLLNPFASGCLRKSLGAAKLILDRGWADSVWGLPPAGAERSARSLSNPGAAPMASLRLLRPPARLLLDGRALQPWGRMARLGGGLSGEPAVWTAPSLGSRELSGGGRRNGAWNPTAGLDAAKRACSRAISGPVPPLIC